MGEALQALTGGDTGAEERFGATARQYIELLTNHIHEEDNILFTMGDTVVAACSPSRGDRLLRSL